MKKWIVIANDDEIVSLDLHGQDVENAHVVAIGVVADDSVSAIISAIRTMSGSYVDLVAYEIVGW